MCGFVGLILHKEINKIKISKIITNMNNTLFHRGPDSSGIWIDNNIALAHRRLSILDLSNAGNQPMISSNKRYVLIFNGEIYNHPSIRADLETNSQKINWNGSSDTETLLLALECWGLEKTLKKIRGMFAFAVWDRKKKKLILVKDFVGEKPLYYGWINNDFVFASELKAIIKHPNFEKKICRDA